MIVIIPYHKDTVIGAYSDMNRAKRAAKERLPYAHKRVRFVSFEVDDGVTDEDHTKQDQVQQVP